MSDGALIKTDADGKEVAIMDGQQLPALKNDYAKFVAQYFPNMRRSCNIGPIQVLPNPDVVTGLTHSTPSSHATSSNEGVFEPT